MANLSSEPVSTLPPPELNEAQLSKAAQLIAHCIPYRPNQDLAVTTNGREDQIRHDKEYLPGDELLIVQALAKNGIDALHFSYVLSQNLALAGNPQTLREIRSQNFEAFTRYKILIDLAKYLTLDQELLKHVTQTGIPLTNSRHAFQLSEKAYITRHAQDNNLHANFIMNQDEPDYQTPGLQALVDKAGKVHQINKQRSRETSTEKLLLLDQDYLTSRLDLAASTINYHLSQANSSTPVPSPA